MYIHTPILETGDYKIGPALNKREQARTLFQSSVILPTLVRNYKHSPLVPVASLYSFGWRFSVLLVLLKSKTIFFLAVVSSGSSGGNLSGVSALLMESGLVVAGEVPTARDLVIESHQNCINVFVYTECGNAQRMAFQPC